MNATLRNIAFGYNGKARDSYDFERYFRRRIKRRKALEIEASLRTRKDPSFDDMFNKIEACKWGALAAAVRLKGDGEHAQVFSLDDGLALVCQQHELAGMRFDGLVFPYDRFMIYIRDVDVIKRIWGDDWYGACPQALHLYVERVLNGEKIVLTAATDTLNDVASFGPVSFSATTMQTQMAPTLSSHLETHVVTPLDRMGGRLFRFVVGFLSVLDGGDVEEQSIPSSPRPRKRATRHGSRRFQVTYLRRGFGVNGAHPQTAHATPREHMVRSHMRRIRKPDGSGFRLVRVRAHKRGTKPTGRSGPRRYVMSQVGSLRNESNREGA